MYKINKNLYDYIHETLGAKYKPDPEGVISNLGNDRNKNLRYLGTYFPRSFVESYKIFCNMFDCFSSYHFTLGDTINILDVGSGTGGQLFGLLQALHEKFEPLKINVFSIDGNKDALDIQKSIFYYLNNGYKSKINPHYYHMVYHDKKELAQHLSQSFYKINFILSFKFLSEMILENKGIYSGTLKIAEEILSPDGVLCLVDTTNKIPTKNGYSDYLPSYSNNEVYEYLGEAANTALHYMLPSCCAKNIKQCKRDKCFTCCSFPVYSSNTDHEYEKINYKLFMKQGSFSEKFIDAYSIYCHSSCIETKSEPCYCKANCYYEANTTPLLY